MSDGPEGPRNGKMYETFLGFTFADWIKLAVIVASIYAGYRVLENRVDTNEEDIRFIKKDVADIRSGPIKDIRRRVRGIEGTMQRVDERTLGQKRQLDRIETNLRKLLPFPDRNRDR